MHEPAHPRKPVADSERSSTHKPKLPLTERMAVTPAEFAAGFGKSETWGYRRLYDGSVKAVQVNGRLLIPKSEIDRLLSEAAIYNGLPSRARGAKSSSRRSGKEKEIGAIGE